MPLGPMDVVVLYLLSRGRQSNVEERTPNYLKRSIPWIYNILIGKVTFGYTTVR